MLMIVMMMTMMTMMMMVTTKKMTPCCSDHVHANKQSFFYPIASQISVYSLSIIRLSS